MTKSSPQPSSPNRLDNGTIEITLTLPWGQISAGFEKEVQKAIDQAELPGFRKGRAPRDLVEPKLDKAQLYSHAVQHLLPQAYAEAIKSSGIKPILYPQITITKGQENADWEFLAKTCEAPVVTLPAKLAPLDTLKKQVTVKIPDLLVEEESNHRLSALAENLSQLGLTVESYLQSKKITLDSLKAQTAQTSRADLEAEFILEQVRQDQKLPDRKSALEFLQKLV